MHASDLEAARKKKISSRAGSGPAGQAGSALVCVGDLAYVAFRAVAVGRVARPPRACGHGRGGRGSGRLDSTLERAPAPAQADRIILQSIT